MDGDQLWRAGMDLNLRASGDITHISRFFTQTVAELDVMIHGAIQEIIFAEQIRNVILVVRLRRLRSDKVFENNFYPSKCYLVLL